MLNSVSVPPLLQQIASPPKQLFHRGAPLEKLLTHPCIAIVGSRNVSSYGRQVTQQLAGQLAEQGIVIISGLAIGVDGIAHQAAVDAKGRTIAVLPSPVNNIYPSTNRRLAQQILDNGGALVSEYASEGFVMSYKSNFIARNRLIAGLAQAVLITEAAEKSGSLYTARFGLEQGKDILAVPGDITRLTSLGANSLIRAGATPVTSYHDVLHVLGAPVQANERPPVKGSNEHEQAIVDLLRQGVSDGPTLLTNSNLDTIQFNQALTMLEITGKIQALGNNRWSL